MKVAIFTDTFFPQVNGIAVSIDETAQTLAKHGHEVLIVCPSEKNFYTSRKDSYPKYKNIEVFEVPSVNMRVPLEFSFAFPSLKLINKIKLFAPDLIHTHVPLTIGLQGVGLARFLKIPLVTTHHSNYSSKESLKAIGLYDSPVAQYFQAKGVGFITYFLKKHDVIIVPTVDTKNDLLKMGIKKKIRVIPSSIDFSLLKKSKAKGRKLREKYKIKKSIIYVARLSGEKNIDLLIKSFKKSLEKDSELKFVLIGDGQENDELKKLARKLDVYKSIIWMGKVDHQDLISGGYFYMGDVFVTLSKFETQGLSTVEAMACGLPVVGAKARGTLELVNGVGKLVNPRKSDEVAQTILKIMSDEETYSILSKKSVKKAKEFSREEIAKKIISFYEEVVGDV